MTFVDPNGHDMGIRGEGGFGRTALIILLGLLVFALTALVVAVGIMEVLD